MKSCDDMVSEEQIERMTDEHFNNNLCDVNDLLAMSVKLQLENNKKLNKIIVNINDSFGLVEGNIVGIEGITINEGEINSKIAVAINGKIYNCIVKDNVGKHERVVVIGGLTDQPIVSPIKRNRAGEVCGILTENCIVGVKGIALGVATNGNPVSVRIGNKAYSCLAKSDITEYEEVVIVGGTISEPYVFATNTTVEGVTAKNDAATEKPLLDGMEYEALGALTTDADTAGDKVPVKGSAKGVQYVVPVDSSGLAEAAIDPVNTARTTATVVQAVQEVDATGKVSPAGELITNAPYANVTEQSPLQSQGLDEKLLNAVTAVGASTAAGVLSYKELTICVVATAISSGGTFTFQGSPDLTNWGTVASIDIADLVSATQVITGDGTTYYEIVNASSLKYFRVNLTSYTDGTYTVYLTGRA